MKIITTIVDLKRITDIPWPDGVPLPTAGDFVVMRMPEGGAMSFTVDSLLFSIGIDKDNTPLTMIQIHTHDPAGEQEAERKNQPELP